MKVCCICGKEIQGHGHIAKPLSKGYCCDDCNLLVIAERIKCLESIEFAIQRYEDEVPDMLLGAHDDYMKGQIKATDYAAALRKIYDVLENLYLGGTK